ncbi:hypothetical protein D3C71_1478000 [compost metagenome]
MRSRFPMDCNTSRSASNPNWVAAIWLHHSIRPCASSSTTPLGDACNAANISCRRLSLLRTSACWLRSSRRARSAASPQTPRISGVSASSPVRSQRNTRAPLTKSQTNQAQTATAAPSAAPHTAPCHHPRPAPANCHSRKNEIRHHMRIAKPSQKTRNRARKSTGHNHRFAICAIRFRPAVVFVVAPSAGSQPHARFPPCWTRPPGLRTDA